MVFNAKGAKSLSYLRGTDDLDLRSEEDKSVELQSLTTQLQINDDSLVTLDGQIEQYTLRLETFIEDRRVLKRQNKELKDKIKIIKGEGDN